MSLRNLLNELKENTLAQVRGVGIGASLGAIKYPAASVMVLADRVMSENPQLTYREALNLINEQQQRDRTERPLNAYSGELTGALNPAANLARLGSIPAMMAGGATQGAVAGFNEKQELGDAAFGAVAGATLTGAGGVAGKGQEQVVRWTASRVGAQRADEAARAVLTRQDDLSRIRQAYEVAKKSGAPKRELDALVADARKIQQSIASLRQSQAKGTALVQAAQEAPAAELFAAVRPGLGEGLKPRLGPIAGSAVGDMLGTTRGRLAQGTSDLGAMALLGGGGYMLGGAAGLDPMLGALLGAGAGRGAPLLTKKAGAAAAFIPRNTAPVIGAASTQGIAPILGSVGQKPPAAETAQELDLFDDSDLFDAPAPQAPQPSQAISAPGPSTPTRSASAPAKRKDDFDDAGLFD